MDTDDGEVACERIDIAVDDGAAMLQTVRSLLGLPALDGAIDHTAAAEANWIKLRVTMDSNGGEEHNKAKLRHDMDRAKVAQASKEGQEKE